ncbi:MAG: tRNA (adenosine(37)-N6)-threonylcarbamoyltransferase complex transferase subunit TsaD [Clostridia bacterium]|nr:tRNA (adenosine(37)-N6)-threonylcarbamoyltransferase complex transferase subunit TsaD [Clostridia bacterium]
MKDGKFLTLAFESSCDETSIAVIADGREILSNVISSQIDIHTKFGGVVPEIASRHHLQNIDWVYAQALEEAGVTIDDIDLVGVTYGPGLIGALLVGVAYAKAVAWAKDIPLVGVNHMQGHISANYIEHKDLEPPFMGLVVSGGHTNIIKVTDYNKCDIIGQTLDDAIGEAYDKVARVIGLGYPGGPKIDRVAKQGNPEAIEFKRVYMDKDSYDFSYSGIKTAVINHVHQLKQSGTEIDEKLQADIAASFQQAVLDVVVDKTMMACEKEKENHPGEKLKLAMAGGVASNSRLREMLQARCDQEGIELVIPSPVLCTDNGAMIGCAAYYLYKAGVSSDLDLDANSKLEF